MPVMISNLIFIAFHGAWVTLINAQPRLDRIR